MPSAAYTNSPGDSSTIRGGSPRAQSRCSKPLVNSGSLDKYKHQDLTPVIGREFEGLQVTELLKGEAQLIKDLAVTISERGVIFLRDQDVTPQQMKELMERISEAAGCVSSTSFTFRSE
jgi:hypothetical protein